MECQGIYIVSQEEEDDDEATKESVSDNECQSLLPDEGLLMKERTQECLWMKNGMEVQECHSLDKYITSV